MTPADTVLHGSAVSVAGHGLLILGTTGSGKSSLAFELMSRGAALIADDRVEVRQQGDRIMLSSPPSIAGLIEARGVGVLQVAYEFPVPLQLVVDLDRETSDRLPERHDHRLLDQTFPVILGKGRRGLAAILMVLLNGGSLSDPRSLSTG